MDNTRMLEWVFQTSGGIILFFACGALGFAYREIFRLRSDHSALEAKVNAQNDEVQRRFDRVEDVLNTLGVKIDALLARHQ